MALHPDVQQKAQAEINTICDYEPYSSYNQDLDLGTIDTDDEFYLPLLADLDRLPYLLAIMKEVLRYAPVANLGESNLKSIH